MLGIGIRDTADDSRNNGTGMNSEKQQTAHVRYLIRETQAGGK